MNDKQTIWGFPVHERAEPQPVGVAIRFGDMSAYITLTMAQSEAVTPEGIDRAAHDLNIYVALSGRIYYKGAGVESIFGVPAAEIGPQILQRRRELGLAP
jgi:hypothetical protein